MFEKEIWIAHRKKVETNDFGVEIEYFNRATQHYMNYQPVSAQRTFYDYGQQKEGVYRAYVNSNSMCNIKVGDRAYLIDGDIRDYELRDIATCDNEFCENANYVVDIVLPQNFKTRIDFKKIK